MNDTPVSPPKPPFAGKEQKIYEIGTLRYTQSGLYVLFAWLVWGDFALFFFEQIFNRFIPLYFKDLHASNTLIGVMTGSIAGAVNLLFLPNISRWSDGYRSRIGRRIPFLYVVTPITVTSLVLVGFAPEIGGWIYSHVPAQFAAALSNGALSFIHFVGGRSGSLSENGALILSLLCVFAVSFHFSNMVLVNAYNWLLRDVLPQNVIGGFLSCFRVVEALSSVLFLWFVFPHILTNRREVCAGVGLFYLVSFLCMCVKVKEGSYPPTPPREERPGIFKSFILYFKESLRLPLYRNYFLTYIMVLLASTSATQFSLLFVRNSLGLSMADIGPILAWGTGASALLLVPIGRLCDKFSPLLIGMVFLAASVVASALAFFFIHDKFGFTVYTVAFALPQVGWGLAQATATMKLFPSEKFGQLSSALNVLATAALIPGNFLIGKLMDLVNSNYRVVFLWSAVFFALAIVFLFLVYRDWKRYGGPDHYVAPIPE